MLELGRAGTHGVGTGVRPVLSDGVVVGTLQASNWRAQATAVVSERAWAFTKRSGELRARWTVDPEESARLRARQTSFWKGTWVADLDGTLVEVEKPSFWSATHRFVAGGQQVAHSGSTGNWSPRPTLTAAPGMPLDHQVFLLWLELVIRRRNTGDGTAGPFGDGGGGGGGD